MSLRNRIFQIVYRVLSSGVQCSAGNILLGRGTGAGYAQEITLGSGLTITGGALTVSGVVPSVHAASHATGQADALTAAAIGAAATVHSHSGQALSPDSVAADSLSTGRNSANASPQTGVLLLFNADALNPVAVSCAVTTDSRNVEFPDKSGTVAMTSDINLANTRAALGIPSYANITAANAALTIGRIYYDEALEALNTATA